MEDRLHYKRVRLLVDGLIYRACLPCSFAVFPHGTTVRFSGAGVVGPQCVAHTAQQCLRRNLRSVELPTAYHVSGSIWLLYFETACNGATVLGVYFSQNGGDDDALKAAAREMMRAHIVDAGCHAVCTSSNPSERGRRSCRPPDDAASIKLCIMPMLMWTAFRALRTMRGQARVIEHVSAGGL